MAEVGKTRWKNLGPRFLTAVIVLLVCVAPFYIGGYIWALLVAVFSVRIMYEWIRMTDPDAGLMAMGIAVAGLLVALIYAVQDLPIWAFGTLVLTMMFAIAERVPRGGLGWAAIGVPYVILPSVLLVLLRGDDVGFDTRGFTQLIFIILIVIAADVGAYFGGSSIGGPKLAPKLSPNKTWAGVFSGLLFAIIVGVIAGFFIGLPVSLSIMLIIPIVAFSVVGDLLESTAKRRVGIKDTGSLLPGHGGLLDRLDSLMLAVVGAAILFVWLGERWPIA